MYICISCRSHAVYGTKRCATDKEHNMNRGRTATTTTTIKQKREQEAHCLTAASERARNFEQRCSSPYRRSEPILQSPNDNQLSQTYSLSCYLFRYIFLSDYFFATNVSWLIVYTVQPVYVRLISELYSTFRLIFVCNFLLVFVYYCLLFTSMTTSFVCLRLHMIFFRFGKLSR